MFLFQNKLLFYDCRFILARRFFSIAGTIFLLRHVPASHTFICILVVFKLIFTFSDVPILNLAMFLDNFCEKNIVVVVVVVEVSPSRRLGACWRRCCWMRTAFSSRGPSQLFFGSSMLCSVSSWVVFHPIFFPLHPTISTRSSAIF